MYGDNTKTKVTILDDDKPGKFQFRQTSMQMKKSDKSAQIIIERIDGADGKAECRFKTVEVPSCPNPARQFIDYKIEDKVVTFKAGQSEQIVEINFLNYDASPETKKDGPDSPELVEAVMIYARLEDPSPAGVKISKRNICQIELVPED